jgi:hypothetical protein
MTLSETLDELSHRGVVLEASGDRLRYRAPVGALTPELRDALVMYKGRIARVAPGTSLP